MTGLLKIHMRNFLSRRFAACGQSDVPEERFAKFREDVTCLHCQVFSSILPKRALAAGPADERGTG